MGMRPIFKREIFYCITVIAIFISFNSIALQPEKLSLLAFLCLYSLSIFQNQFVTHSRKSEIFSFKKTSKQLFVQIIRSLQIIIKTIYFIGKHKSLRKSNIEGYYLDDCVQVMILNFVQKHRN